MQRETTAQREEAAAQRKEIEKFEDVLKKLIEERIRELLEDIRTPARVLFGREMWLTCHLMLGEDLPGEDYVNKLIKLATFTNRFSPMFDIRAAEGEYAEGDLVWLCNPQRMIVPKLRKASQGPIHNGEEEKRHRLQGPQDPQQEAEGSTDGDIRRGPLATS